MGVLSLSPTHICALYLSFQDSLTRLRLCLFLRFSPHTKLSHSSIFVSVFLSSLFFAQFLRLHFSLAFHSLTFSVHLSVCRFPSHFTHSLCPFICLPVSLLPPLSHSPKSLFAFFWSNQYSSVETPQGSKNGSKQN